MVLVRSASVVNSHRQPWRGTLSLSTVQDRTDPADMESMLKKCVLTLVLAWRVGAAVEPEVSFSGPACLGVGRMRYSSRTTFGTLRVIESSGPAGTSADGRDRATRFSIKACIA